MCKWRRGGGGEKGRKREGKGERRGRGEGRGERKGRGGEGRGREGGGGEGRDQKWKGGKDAVKECHSHMLLLLYLKAVLVLVQHEYAFVGNLLGLQESLQLTKVLQVASHVCC